jgi:hypothetical protein
MSSFPPNLVCLSPHSALISGQTGSGKTVFVMDLLEGPYKGFFDHIVFLCPTVGDKNESYVKRPWVWTDSEVYIVDPGERLLDYLKALFMLFRGTQTLYVIDDCACEEDMAKRKGKLAKLAMTGRHALQSVWCLTQKYNEIPRGFRTQTMWVCLFFTKDRDSFEDCLRENFVIQSSEERDAVRQQLAQTEHAKLVLKTAWPAAYQVLGT